MSCRRLDRGEVFAAWWHRLWCAECRAARTAEAIITRGVEQIREEPIPADSLSRTLAALGMASSQRIVTLSRQEIRARLGRVLFLVGLGIFITTLAQPELIGKPLFEPFLRRQSWIGGAASFWALTALFWYLKPLAAVLVDHVPLFGSRRRLYLIVSASLAAILWLTTLFVPHSPAMMTVACIGVGAMLALGSTVVGGFLVEQGQTLGATGRLGALHQSLLHLAAMIAAPLSGFLAGQALHFTPILGALLLILLAVGSYGLMQEETPAPRTRQTASQVWGQLRTLTRSRTMWSLAAILVLVFSVSSFSSILTDQWKELSFSSSLQHTLEFTSHAASLVGILAYLLICRRYSLQSLLIPGIVGNAVGTLLYLGYHPHLTPLQAILIEVFNGMASALIAVTLFDLAIRAVPVGSECLGYAILMSIINVTSRFSDLLSVRLVTVYHLSFAQVVGMSAAFCLLAILAVPFLPRVLVSRREGEAVLVKGSGQRRAQGVPV